MKLPDLLLTREDKAKIALIIGCAGLGGATMALRGYSFGWETALLPGGLTIALLACAEVYRHLRPEPRFFVMLRETAWLTAFAPIAALLSNVLITLNRPAMDDWLAAVDRALGFDWHAYYDFFTTRPTLGFIAALLYISVLPQLACAIIALALMSCGDRARELCLGAMLGVLIAIVISTFLPSSGALAYFRPDESLLVHQPVVDLDYKQAYFDLRAGLITHFDFLKVRGLIAFPSYHAELCILIALAFRGIRFVFWPIMLLDGAIVLTTPVEGGHDLTSAIGGVVIGVVSLWCAITWRRSLNEVKSPVTPALAGESEAAAARA